jgi:hypothetical protein
MYTRRLREFSISRTIGDYTLSRLLCIVSVAYKHAYCAYNYETSDPGIPKFDIKFHASAAW